VKLSAALPLEAACPASRSRLLSRGWLRAPNLKFTHTPIFSEANSPRRSYCDLNMFNFGAVRHLGFDRKWISAASPHTRAALPENNEAFAELTTANGGTFTSSSARLSSQSRYSMYKRI